MPHQFSETAPGGTVSGRKTVRRQTRGLVLEYDLASSAEEPVSVHIVDGVPTGRPDEFGFHREHEPAEWTLSDGELRMTVALDPGEERTVVLGLVADGDDPAEDTTGPTVDVLAADAAPEDGDADGFFEDGAAAVDADGGPTSIGDDAERGDADDVVSSLVAELEAGTVSESELATLREHLGTGRPESEAARLEYVQKRLGDFDAYVDALEDLLSVHGSGEDAVTELQGRLEAVADDVEAVRQRQDELADRLDELAAAQASSAESVESLRETHEDDVAAVRADLADLEAEVEAFESVRRALLDGFGRTADADEEATSEPTSPSDGRESDAAAQPAADHGTGDGSSAEGTGVSVEPAIDEPEGADGSVEIDPQAPAATSGGDPGEKEPSDTPTASHFTVSSAASEGDSDATDADDEGCDEDGDGADEPAADDRDDGFLAPDQIDGIDADDAGDDTDADGGSGTDANGDVDAVDDVPATGNPDDDAAVEGDEEPSDDPGLGDDPDFGDDPDAASDEVTVADAESEVAPEAAVVPFEGDGPADGAAASEDTSDDGERDEDEDGGGWTSSIF